MVTTTLPGAGSTNHHDGTNSQPQKMFRQSCMVNDMEVEDYFLRKLQERAIQPKPNVSLLSKQLKGYVLDGHQTGIANGKYLVGIDQFTDVKVIHSGAV